MPDEPVSLPPGITVAPIGAEANPYKFPQEWLLVNVFEILTILREVRDERRTWAKGDWVIGSFTTFLAFALSLVATSNYRDLFGFKNDVWQSVILYFTLLSGATTLILFGLWIATLIRHRARTDRQIVQGLIDDMREAKETGTVFLGH